MQTQWNKAEQAWLNAAARRSTHTARSYQATMEEFKAFLGEGKSLDTVGGADVERYLESIEDGRSAATVNTRLSALGSFYTYCMRRYTAVDADGHECALANFNPVDRVRRVRVRKYGKARHLTTEQVIALLELPDRSDLSGARDYAIMLMALLTGRRSAEIRNLQWGEIDKEMYSWIGKRGVARTDTMPGPVWAAIMNYIRIAGRDLSDTDPVFSSERYTHQPLSSQYLNSMVKRYAKQIGIDWLTFHGLRHTAAYLRHRAGQSVLEISRALSHSNLEVTQVYLDHVLGQGDEGWRGAWQVIEDSSKEEPEVPILLCTTARGQGAQGNTCPVGEGGSTCDNQNYHKSQMAS